MGLHAGDVESDFGLNIGRPARGALANEGITTYEQLTEYTADELLALHGVGPKAIRILGEELAAQGLGFHEGD